jgi:Protein of unknown function (DUF3828)
MKKTVQIGCLALLVPLVLSPTVVAQPISPQQSTKSRPVQANPISVVDQFYQEYITKKRSWRDLKAAIDPATYEQLSRVQQFDVEPFLDAQVSAWSYQIGTTQIKGNEALVPVQLMVGLRRAEVARNLTIVLRNNQNRWQIRNVIYSAQPLPSGEPNDLLHLWKPAQLSDSEILERVRKLPEVQQIQRAIAQYAKKNPQEKIRFGMRIETQATASNPEATVVVYESHPTHRSTVQRFLVNPKTREIRVVDRLTSRPISLQEWRDRRGE